MNDDDDEPRGDEIMIGPEIAPGVHEAIRRAPDGKIRRVACTPMRDGVHLLPGAEVADVGEPSEDGWRKLTSRYKLGGGDGPAQVATPVYRENFDRIFGKKPTVGEA